MLERYQSLLEQLDLGEGVPFSPNWSAEVDFLQLLVDHCRRTRPSLIVECSSGLSTLVLARSCQISGHGRVISLEDGLEFALRTRDYLDRYALAAFAEVIHAPLREVELDGVRYAWYGLPQLPDEPVDMLVVDGPSGYIQKHSRFPALPLLYSRLAAGARIFLDDAARSDEQDIIAMWQARYPRLHAEYIANARGCAVFALPESS